MWPRAPCRSCLELKTMGVPCVRCLKRLAVRGGFFLGVLTLPTAFLYRAVAPHVSTKPPREAWAKLLSPVRYILNYRTQEEARLCLTGCSAQVLSSSSTSAAGHRTDRLTREWQRLSQSGGSWALSATSSLWRSLRGSCTSSGKCSSAKGKQHGVKGAKKKHRGKRKSSTLHAPSVRESYKR